MKGYLEAPEINLGFKEIKGIKKDRFKSIVKKSVNAINAFKYLMSLKQKQSKMESLQYSELKTQSYMKSKIINAELVISAFCYRVRMARVRQNYPKSYSAHFQTDKNIL